jgi:hypothetical protein
VANPNWSLAILGKNSPKNQLFGPHFEENRGKPSKISKNY